MDILDAFKRTLHEDYDDYTLDEELKGVATAIDNGSFDEYTGKQNIWFSLVNWTPEQKSLFKQMLQDDSIEVTFMFKNELADVNSELNDEISPPTW